MSLISTQSNSSNAFAAPALSTLGLHTSRLANSTSVDFRAEELNILGDPSPCVTPIRQAWWMKHLSLLAILQAACLAIGLMVHSLIGTIVSISILTTFTWITCIQGALSYLIFSRLYREQFKQQDAIKNQLDGRTRALGRTQDAMVLGLTKLAEVRVGDTEGHLDRVGKLSARLAEVAQQRPEFQAVITPQFIRLIRFSAALHDIGKVGIEDAILLKPGQLTQLERSKMECHTRISSACLSQIQDCLGDANFLEMAHEIALFHHERWDGSGYPTGIAGEEIPLSARIVAIADVYDALAARRPYKEPFEHQRCIEIISADAGTHFDPRLVELFLAIHTEFASVSQSDANNASDPTQVAEPHAAVVHSNDPGSNQLESLLSSVDHSLPSPAE